MQKMITGCAVPFLLFAIFFYGYASVFLLRIEPEWLAYVLAGIGALMLNLAIGAMKTLFQTRTIAEVLSRARKMRPPKDGKLTLIQGKVEAVGETIHAPFSKTPCVSYEYGISRSKRTDEREHIEYRTIKEPFAFGLAKTSYVIRTSSGDVRPMGYPMLEHLPKSSWHFSKAGNDQIRQSTEAFLKNEKFQKAGGLRMAKAFSQLIKAMEKETDFVRKDWKVRDPKNLNDLRLYETCLEPWSQICALGKWDKKRLALRSPNELIAGDLQDVKKILIANKRSSAVVGLIFGCLFSAMIIALALFLPKLGPMSQLSPEARLYKNQPIFTIIDSAPAHVIRELCQAGADPNQPSYLGTPPILLTRDAEKVQALLECGADPDMRNANGETKLNEAARYGDAKTVRALLDAKADIEAEMPHLGRGWTAMVSAYTAGRSEIVEILTDAGALDERVNAATGSPLTAKRAPLSTVRAYLAAIQAGDLETMKHVCTGKRPNWSDRINIEAWKINYPSEAKLKQGFGNSKAATIELETHLIENFTVRWFFHLENIAGGNATPQWRILREWNLPLYE